MKDLTIRLDALDPQAGAALRVIAYFDDLSAHGAGLAMIVRAAALLAQAPAALVDEGRRVRIRVSPDGSPGEPVGEPDPAWPRTGVGSGVLWLEYAGPPRPVDAMVLERAAAAAAAVLDRTRGRAVATASLETLFDAEAPEEARALAGRRLGLPETGLLRAVAYLDGRAAVLRHDEAPMEGSRAGVGPGTPLLDLPASWEAARLALRLTADGSDHDPGPRVVHAAESGALLLLARAVTPETPEIEDVTRLDRAAQSAPWMLATLDAIVSAPSLRAAASTLLLHHSTLQDRLVQAERLLGWPPHTPQGRLRLQLALTLRRLHRAP
ncbi:helix-turn-helix domain-containing protein [Actinocorallia sp. A-T 12471]|uniref:helix-turn-helix domain-containing protein n=1 Tax=Actinocorallia sp. A-T 12471 TaxID=3089813 RepID=UPI0029D04234|nr:helix-turn-helix domain-containing protein [Actinocorallia sp. A-T 12471]MDX6744826.1 helix-turn-helix domain-containing protein [Actinocorallia sp. A-T 12471]